MQSHVHGVQVARTPNLPSTTPKVKKSAFITSGLAEAGYVRTRGECPNIFPE